MTRNKMLKKLYKLANELIKDYTLDKWNEMWDLCCDWNRIHNDESEEIFMSETCDEEDRVNGFMIEDDVWRWEDID